MVHKDRLVSFLIEFLWSFIENPSVINRCLFMFPQEKLHHNSPKAMSNSWINIKILEPTTFLKQQANVKDSRGCCFFLSEQGTRASHHLTYFSVDMGNIPHSGGTWLTPERYYSPKVYITYFSSLGGILKDQRRCPPSFVPLGSTGFP